MLRRIVLVMVPLVLFLVAGRSVAYADPALSADIPFKFVAGGSTHDPGRYELRVNDGDVMLTLVPAKGAEALLSPLTRLASRDGQTDPCLVFDKVGNTYILSEAWFPGLDGFMLHATKEPHTHQVVKVTSKPKAD